MIFSCLTSFGLEDHLNNCQLFALASNISIHKRSATCLFMLALANTDRHHHFMDVRHL
jgi:hypothetical protein